MGMHIFGWLIATFLMLFILPAVISPSVYVAQVHREQAALVDNLGEESANKIIQTADKTYIELFEDSGIHSGIIEHFGIPEKDLLENKPAFIDPLNPNTGAVKYERKMQSYFVALFISFYEWIFRFTQLLIWLSFVFPFVLAAIWDGIVNRKIKAETFVYSHPSIYYGLWHALIFITFLSIFIFNIPFAIKPLIYPILITTVAFLIRSLVSNLQRSA
jgi:hypothetical protein